MKMKYPIPNRSLLLLVMSILASQVIVRAQNQGIAFENASVITMSNETVLENHTVLTEGDAIVAIGPSNLIKTPPNYDVVDAKGKFLMPGLMDMHVHLSDKTDLLANLRWGVTSVLQMSGQRGAIDDFISLRDSILNQHLLGPRLFLTGPMFERIGLSVQTTAYAIEKEEDVAKFLETHAEKGYDFFKVHNLTSRQTYKSLSDASSLPIVGHIPIRNSIDEVLSGHVMIAHAMVFYYNLFFDPTCRDGFWACMANVTPDFSVMPDLVEKIKKSGVTITANLSILAVEQSNDDNWNGVLNDPEFRYLGPSLKERWYRDNPLQRGEEREIRRKDIDNQYEFNQELVKRLNAAGVPIIAGTDAGVEGLFPGKSIHLELAELVDAGLTPFDALRTATSTPGQFLRKHVKRSRPMGHIEPGFAADLILLEANPLDDIQNSQNIIGTLSQGIWRTSEMLDKVRTTVQE